MALSEINEEAKAIEILELERLRIEKIPTSDNRKDALLIAIDKVLNESLSNLEK